MERGTNQASKPLRRQNRLRLCEQWEFEGKGTRTTQWFCVILILIEISWLSWSGFFHPFRFLIAHFEGSHPKSEIWAPIFFPNNGMDQVFEIPQWRQVSSMYAKSRLGPQARFGACPGWNPRVFLSPPSLAAPAIGISTAVLEKIPRQNHLLGLTLSSFFVDPGSHK